MSRKLVEERLKFMNEVPTMKSHDPHTVRLLLVHNLVVVAGIVSMNMSLSIRMLSWSKTLCNSSKHFKKGGE